MPFHFGKHATRTRFTADTGGIVDEFRGHLFVSRAQRGGETVSGVNDE